MKIDTLLHTEHQLDQLSGQFEHWRQRRSHLHERIPEPLWEQAVALTATLSPSRVAKHLRLRVSDLKEQITKRQGSTAAQRPPHPAPPSFVEVPPQPVQPQGLGCLEVELHRPDGARLRMHSPDASLPLAAIVHSFLAARLCSNSPRNAASLWPRNPSISAKASMASVPCVDSAWAGTALTRLLDDGQGYWMMMKRLSQGRCLWWPNSTDARVPLSARELLLVLWNGDPERAQMARDWRRVA